MPAGVLDGNGFRGLAEWVDGMRNQDVYAYQDANGNWRVVGAVPTDCPAGQWIQCHTDDIAPKRPHADSVWIGLGNQAERVATNKFDAMFWSESSWDKFMWPYYARMNRPDALHIMWTTLTNPSVMALIHEPKSETVIIPSPPGAADRPTSVVAPGVVYRDQNGNIKVGTYAQFLIDLPGLGAR